MINILRRMRIVGAILVAAGLTVAGIAFLYGAPTANAGLDSAQAMYQAQGVELSYNEEGELLDRGTPEGAAKIMAMLRDDWDYPVKQSSFDPDDPIINTRDELMYQYAVITYHVYHGERTIVLGEADVPISYRGIEYTEPGEYPIAPLAYYAQLDRTHPIERQLREAWSPLALSLTAQLAGGHANQAAGELAMATSIGLGGVGVLFAMAGGGLVWISYGKPQVRPRSAVPSRAASQKVPQDSGALPAAEPPLASAHAMHQPIARQVRR